MKILIKALIPLYKKLPLPFRTPFQIAFRIINWFLRKRTVIADVNGVKYELNLNELIDSSLYFKGYFEKYTTNAINQLTTPGMIIIDIGANVGSHTYRFAKLTGPSGMVVGFEPTSLSFQKLQRNFDINNFTNVVLENIALADYCSSSKEIEFYSSWPLNREKNSQYHPIHGGLRGQKEVVNFITLDSYVDNNDFDRIDLIKIDVDGYEYKVIKGSMETIERYQPIIIMELVEYTHMEVGTDIYEMVTILNDIGYTYYSDVDLMPISVNRVKNLIGDGKGFNAILSKNKLLFSETD